MAWWGSFFRSAAEIAFQKRTHQKRAQPPSGLLGVASEQTLGSLRALARQCVASANHSKVREHLERILAVQTGRFGVSDCRTLAAEVDLANHLQVTGAYTEAQSHYDRALYWYRQVAGEYDPNVLVLKFTKAQSFLREGDLLSAKTLLLHIYGASRQFAGQHEHATLLYLDSLAATLVRISDGAAARETVAELLVRRGEASVASECATSLATASVLVTNLLNTAQWSEALPIQEGILTLLRRGRGENDPETLLASSLYAMILVESGELTLARALLQKISERFIKTLGPDHSQTLTVCFLLGAVMARQGDNIGARAILERSYRIAKRNPPSDHMAATRLGTELGTVLVRLQDYAAAENLLREVLHTCEIVNGENDPSTLTNINNLAVALWEQGRLEQSLKMQEDLVRRRRRQYGNAHIETIESMTTLAFMHAQFERKRKVSQIAAGGCLLCITEPRELPVEISTCIVINEVEILTKIRGFQIPAC